MSRHTHRVIESTRRMGPIGGPTPHCRRETLGQYCSNGERMTADCRCGAHGVWCPDHGWHWELRLTSIDQEI